MFLGSFKLFQCDFCNLQISVKQLPKDWFWIKKGVEGGQGHSCPDCTNKADASKLVASGKNN